MGGQKCGICQKPIASNQAVVRVIVEAVSRQDDGGTDPAYWDHIHDWHLLHMVHLTCAARALNKGKEPEYAFELNELPLDELVDELVVPENTVVPLRLVHDGSG